MIKKNPPYSPHLPSGLEGGSRLPAGPRADWAAAYGVRVAPHEAALASHVERAMTGPRERLPGPMNDTGPRGPARPALVREEVEVYEWHPARVEPVKVRQDVMRRAPSPALAKLRPECREAAGRYEGLVERIAAIRAPGDGGGGGVSDGGATTRCAWAEQVRAYEAIIGEAPVLRQRGVHAHSDRGRRSITRLDVVRAVVLDGMGTGDVLARFGWSRWSRNQQAVAEALSDALTDLAEDMGLLDARVRRQA